MWELSDNPPKSQKSQISNNSRCCQEDREYSMVVGGGELSDGRSREAPGAIVSGQPRLRNLMRLELSSLSISQKMLSTRVQNWETCPRLSAGRIVRQK